MSAARLKLALLAAVLLAGASSAQAGTWSRAAGASSTDGTSAMHSVRDNKCLHYHPSVGYYNGCTREGRAMTERFNRQGECQAYHPSVGYYNQCTPQGRAMSRQFERNHECQAYHPSVGYYDQCTPEGRALSRRFERHGR